MRSNSIFIALVLLATIQTASFAQDRLDTLYFTNGTREAVTVTANRDEEIEYVFPGETLTNTLRKDKIVKIVFRSGRVQLMSCDPGLCTSAPKVVDPNVARMAQLKQQGKVGHFKDLLDPLNISLSVKLSDDVASRVESNVDDAARLCAIEFKKGIAPVSGYFVNGDYPCRAVVTIVMADDDGEVYGILDYYNEGQGAPVVSTYINGNGHRAGTFVERIMEGTRRAAIKAEQSGVLYHPSIHWSRKSEIDKNK